MKTLTIGSWPDKHFHKTFYEVNFSVSQWSLCILCILCEIFIKASLIIWLLSTQNVHHLYILMWFWLLNTHFIKTLLYTFIQNNVVWKMLDLEVLKVFLYFVIYFFSRMKHTKFIINVTLYEYLNHDEL